MIDSTKLMHLSIGLFAGLNAFFMFIFSANCPGPPLSLWWFLVLFFFPDLSLLGKLGGQEYSASLYIVLHSYTTPLIYFALTGVNDLFISRHPLMLNSLFALLPAFWITRIAFERFFGFGLK